MTDLPDVDEEQTKDADEMLDWLCWAWATEAERFYPPHETADECIDTVGPTDAEARGWEHGQHSRAFAMAVERFNDLCNYGYDPKARAEREIERSRAEGLDLSDIDWSWLEDSGVQSRLDGG